MIFGSLHLDDEISKNNYLIEILATNNHGLFSNNHDSVTSFSDNGHKYYSLHHGSEYKVKMTNNTINRVNALLKIDGVQMGKWRIDPFSDIIIERPADNQRKFTFVKETSWEAISGDVIRGDSNNGLIEVTFIPELRMRASFYPPTNSLISNSFSSNSYSSSAYSAGATVLGEDSRQSFGLCPKGSATNIYEDHTQKVTRRVRLVVSDRKKPFASIRSHSINYDDPIPPKIESRGRNLWSWN